MGGFTSKIKLKAVKTIQSNIELELIDTFSSNIIDHYHYDNNRIVITNNRTHINNDFFDKFDIVIFNKFKIFCIVEKGLLKVISQEKIVMSEIKVNKIFVIDNVLYGIYYNKVYEFEFNNLGRVILSVKNTYNILPYSTKLYKNILISDMLGNPYIIKFNNFEMINIPELIGYKIIDAKYDKNVCMIIGYKDSKYDKLILRLNDSKYDLRLIENINIYIVTLL